MMDLQRPTFYERYYIWLLLGFAALIPLVVIGAIESEKTNNNNITQWLPDGMPARVTYQDFKSHFVTDQYAMVSWEGCTLDDERLPRYAERLREYTDEDGDKLFEKVTTGGELRRKLEAEPFDLDEETSLQRLKGIVIGRDEKTSCAVVELSHKGDNNRLDAVNALRSILVDEIGVPAQDIHMAGDAVTNAAVDVTSKSATDSLVGFCVIIAAICALVSLRDVKLLIVVFVVSGFCGVLAQSLVPALGGRMNLVLVVMPVLVFVLGLSAGIHLVNYYRDVMRESGTAGAATAAIRLGWLPCTLAAGTTAIGLASLSVSKIIPVKDFGKYSAIGIVASLAVLFLLLPSLLILMQRIRFGKRAEAATGAAGSAAHRGFFDRFVDWIADFVIGHHWPMTLLSLAILGFVGLGSMRINTSVKPARFFHKQHQLVRDYRWLAEPDRFGNQIPLEIVVAFDRKHSALTTRDQFRLVKGVQDDLLANNSDYIGSAMSAATFAPILDGRDHYVENKRLAKARQDYRNVHYYSYRDDNGKPEPIPDVKLEPGDERPAEALAGTEEEPQVGKDLWRISTRVQNVEDDYDEVIIEVREHVNAYLTETLKRRRESLVKKHQKFEARQAAVRDRLLAECQDSENAAECRAQVESNYQQKIESGKQSFEKARQEIEQRTAGVELTYTGMVPLFHEAQRELLAGLFKSFIYAFILIAGLMIFWFRSLSAGLVSMLPNIFPAAVIFGWMGWTGRIVDIGSMMTASVAMGIAVDDTVHFLTWFRRGMQEDMTRSQAVLHGYRKCALAMTQTTMIAGFGLSVFGLSSFQPVSQFGLLMFVLLAAALVGDLIFLPALLAGPAGKLFEPKKAGRTPVHESPQPVA